MRLRHLLAPGLIALATACSSLPPLDQNGKPADGISDQEAAKIYIDKGVQYMEGGQYDIALQDLSKAIDLDDDNSEAYNALGVLYQQLNNVSEADSHFRKALSIKPDNYAARNNFGRLLCSTGRTAEAFEQFTIVTGTRLYGQQWIPLTNAGVCAHSVGKLTEAERYLRSALAANPAFPPALLEMAKLSRETGQPIAARGFLQRYISAAGATPESLTLGVDIEMALGNPQSASEYMQTLRTRFPDSPDVMRERQRLGN
jgi:type IV pilus assembly protein PilF